MVILDCLDAGQRLDLTRLRVTVALALSAIAAWTGYFTALTVIAVVAACGSFGRARALWSLLIAAPTPEDTTAVQGVDCRCYFTNNFYLRAPVEGHFTYAGEAAFAEENGALLERLSAPDRAELLFRLEFEADRRRSQGALAAQRKASIASAYSPLHPELWSAPLAEWLHPSFVALVEGARRGGADWAPPAALAEVCPGVYALPIFSARFCAALCEELEAVRRSALPTGRPNSMNAHGVLLDELGLSPAFSEPLMRDWIRPLCAALPPLAAAGGASLDHHKAFVVKYALGDDEELASHFDNAEVTLNANLGRGFANGELLFYGDEGPKGAPPTVTAHEWAEAGVGHGVLHLGSRVHAALPITAGERLNLVVWCRSAEQRRTAGCPMCGRADQFL